MPKNSRIILASITVVALLAAGISYGLFEQGRYEQGAQRQASDYARHAANRIGQSCDTGVRRVQLADCLKKDVAEYRLKVRDNQREQTDLVAQRKSALWTMIMGIAALIGMALSVVGVVLVWTTFRATKESNDIARDAMQRQLRAYVFPELIQFKVTTDVKGHIQEIRLSQMIKNYGQTPAKILTYAQTVSILEGQSPPQNWASHNELDTYIPAGQSDPFDIDLVIPVALAEAIHGGEATASARIALTFMDVFFHTFFVEFAIEIAARDPHLPFLADKHGYNPIMAKHSLKQSKAIDLGIDKDARDRGH